MLTTDDFDFSNRAGRASALGVSVDDLRTAEAVAAALAGGAKWDGTYGALEASYLEWASDNGREPSTCKLSARTYGNLARVFSAQQRHVSGQVVASPLGVKYMNCTVIVSVGVDDGVIVWE